MQIAFLLCCFFISSCATEYKFKLEIPKKTVLNKTIKVTLLEENSKEINKIQFFVNGKEITTKGNSVTINTANLGVGKHLVSALVFYAEKSKKINNSFEVLADIPYQAYTYKITSF